MQTKVECNLGFGNTLPIMTLLIVFFFNKILQFGDSKYKDNFGNCSEGKFEKAKIWPKFDQTFELTTFLKNKK